MSQTKAQLISGTATQDLTVENITATKINDAPIRNPNLIINGAMQIAQRGTSSTTSGYGTVDRFRVTHENNAEAPTQESIDVSDGDLPFTKGLTKSMRITVGNNNADANDILVVIQKIEATVIRNSGWNYKSYSDFVTLSFYVKSSVAQNFFGRIITFDGTAMNYVFQTGELVADTWTKVTKTIPGNSNLTFDNNVEQGMQVIFSLFEGTDKTDNSTTVNAWSTYSDTARTPDQTSTWFTTNNATFQFTGVKLELGATATDYLHLSNTEELIQCQRYFQKVRGGIGTNASSTQVNGVLQTRVLQRADASLSKGTGNTYNYGNMINTGYTSTATPTFFRNDGPFGHYCYSLAGFSGLVTGEENRDEGDGSSATFDLDAEL